MRYLMFLFLLSAPCLAGTIDPSTPDSKYIEYGSSFDCVVKIEGKYKDNTLFEASAVIIDEYNFLTAAHVVQNYKECRILSNKKIYSIRTVLSHPEFDEDKCGFADIAIGHSENKFEIENYPGLYDGDNEVGKVCSVSGYGFTGNFNTGAKIYDGKKRAGSNLIDKIDRDLLICTPTLKNADGYTELEFIIASGDSGGPLFIDNKIAGINSLLMTTKKKTESKYNEESGHTRVSKFLPWIRSNKKRYNENQ